MSKAMQRAMQSLGIVGGLCAFSLLLDRNGLGALEVGLTACTGLWGLLMKHQRDSSLQTTAEKAQAVIKQQMNAENADAVQTFACGLVGDCSAGKLLERHPHLYKALGEEGLGPWALDIYSDENLGEADASIMTLSEKGYPWVSICKRLEWLWKDVQWEHHGNVAHTEVHSDIEAIRLSVSWNWNRLWRPAKDCQPRAALFTTKGEGARISFANPLTQADIEALPAGLRRSDDWYGNFGAGVLVSRIPRDTEDTLHLLNTFQNRRRRAA